MRTCVLQISPSCIKESKTSVCRRCRYWRDKDKEKANNAKRNWAEYRKLNRERINEVNLKWQKMKHATDPRYRIAKNLRHRIWLAIKTKPKHHRMNDIIGCSRNDLIGHLESLWIEG